MSKVLGRKLTLCGTRDDVKAALETIDVYARLRLGSECLEAYAAARRCCFQRPWRFL
ncbi:hypothetical protein JOD60_001915 [Microbacterium aurum]|nr:hypothetical protein [Microbacterium aurum]